jgi:glycine betaine transporter
LISNKLNNNILVDFLQTEDGVSNVIFYLINELTLGSILVVVVFLTVFLCLVNAPDSNAPKSIKIIWGVFIGVLAWVMVSFSTGGKANGLEGVKVLSNIGGIFALFILIGVAVNMVIYLFKNRTNEESI